jgi:peroxiredoxin
MPPGLRMNMGSIDPHQIASRPISGPVVEPVWHERADQLVARLNTLGCGRLAPQAGQIFPNIVLPDWQGRMISLSQLCQEGPIVLKFLRGLWCPWCQDEVDNWQAAQPELREAGCRLVLVTPETGAQAAAMAERAGPLANVLCDVDFGASVALGLAYFMGKDLIKAFADAGLDLAEHYGAASGILPITATFVIEVGLRVRFAHVDVDFRRRADQAALLASLRL